MLRKTQTATGSFLYKMLPFVPVSLQHDPIAAYARLALFGGAAYMTWSKQRKVSYALMGAATLSMLTSLTAPSGMIPTLATAAEPQEQQQAALPGGLG